MTVLPRDKKGVMLPPKHFSPERKERFKKSATKKAAKAEDRSAGKGDMRGKWMATEEYKSNYEHIFRKRA